MCMHTQKVVPKKNCIRCNKPIEIDVISEYCGSCGMEEDYDDSINLRGNTSWQKKD